MPRNRPRPVYFQATKKIKVRGFHSETGSPRADIVLSKRDTLFGHFFEAVRDTMHGDATSRGGYQIRQIGDGKFRIKLANIAVIATHEDTGWKMVITFARTQHWNARRYELSAHDVMAVIASRERALQAIEAKPPQKKPPAKQNVPTDGPIVLSEPFPKAFNTGRPRFTLVPYITRDGHTIH